MGSRRVANGRCIQAVKGTRQFLFSPREPEASLAARESTQITPSAGKNPRRPPEAELKVSLGEGAGYTRTSNLACVQS